MKNNNYLFSGNIDISLKTATKIFASYPKSSAKFLKLYSGLKKSEALRNNLKNDGIEVPPLLIVSTTEQCNLSCDGCYSSNKEYKPNENLSIEKTKEITQDASDLGVSIVMLAGGEPLLSSIWLDSLAEHDEMTGIVFTNGTLLNQERIKWFDKNRHIIPTISIEGNKKETDSRRGEGVFDAVNKVMEKLKSNAIPFGISLTVTNHNIDLILSEDFIKEYLDKGCRVFFFVEYVPVAPGSESLIISNEEKAILNKRTTELAKKYPALFIPFPGDEDMYGGCLAAGRGFIHVSPNGDIEPCPFAQFSDTNLNNVSLKEALSSKLLKHIRDNHHLLKEGSGGCALWNNRDFIKSLQ